jgi:hypothetical protein
MGLLKPVPGKTYPKIHTLIATTMGVPDEDRATLDELLRATFVGAGGFSRRLTLYPRDCHAVLSIHKLSIVAAANF